MSHNELRGNGVIKKQFFGWLPPQGADRRTAAEVLGMPQEFNTEWADMRVAITEIAAATKFQSLVLEDVRKAQIERAQAAAIEAKIVVELERRVMTLEANAWTWGRFRAAWPQVAAGATIIGFVVGLILWLTKHLHL